MCRKDKYQTRIIRDGHGHYRHKCATVSVNFSSYQAYARNAILGNSSVAFLVQ